MSATTSDAAPLTVVLVHGAFTDASSWNGVIERLPGRRGAGDCTPESAARPLSRLGLHQVVPGADPGTRPRRRSLVHRCVISNAATDAKNVVALVFVAAFATDDGETVGEVASTSKDAILSTALVPLHYPVGDGAETAVELAVDPAKFRDVVAADLPAEQTAVMAATQRPIAELAFSGPCGPPAWKTLPAWAIVATDDKAAGAELVRSQAERAGATITEVEGPHVIMISQPEAVADVILTAAAAVDRQAAAAGG
jgi:hypothetical protein